MAKRKKRVALITDTAQHIGPYIAKKLAERNHDLVISDPNVVIEGAKTLHPNLVAELKALGGRVEVVDVDDVNKAGSVQKLVDRAMEVYGGFDSAFIRPGIHRTADRNLCVPWDKMTADDYRALFEGNELSTFYALQALIPPLVAQGSGQVLIEASATAAKDMPGVTIRMKSLGSGRVSFPRSAWVRLRRLLTSRPLCSMVSATTMGPSSLV
jgi:NAD(P)-dependent dehydrogenase (short-subunit alcohol dehydrogenase family)